jgi:hypothetical protein
VLLGPCVPRAPPTLRRVLPRTRLGTIHVSVGLSLGMGGQGYRRRGVTGQCETGGVTSRLTVLGSCGAWPRLESMPLPHYLPDSGVRLTGPGLTVAYTEDTGPDPGLAGLGRDADLCIAGATDRSQQPGAPAAPPGPAMNLSAREADEAAAAARAGRLLLCHFWPGNDRLASRAAAAAAFSGEILLASEGLGVPLG